MKKIILILLVLCCFSSISLFAQENVSKNTQDSIERYQLFSTQNMWTFLKLDTMTGKIWQVQYSVKEADYRFETVLSSVDISGMLEQEPRIGRYTLYPTQNIYSFIMLDQIDGYTFQVQWSAEEENRFVIPIY